MIADIPTKIDDFQPKNSDEKFRGAVKIEEIVIQSLNIPAVRILNDVGLQYFYDHLQFFCPKYLNKGTDHYGLSLILGGGELSLWDIIRLYKCLTRNRYRHESPFSSIKVLQQVEDLGPHIDFSYSSFAAQNIVLTMSDLT